MRLDDLLDKQQKCWNDGDPVSIEDLLEDSPEVGQNSDAIVDLIYSEVLLRESHGECPAKAEYLDRFPNCRELIERQFQLHSALGPSKDRPPVDQSAVSTRTGAKTLGVSPQEIALPPNDLPGFELAERLGRGGSGVAWRARDLNLERSVAIKFLHESENDRGTERLVHEAAAAAKLVHPSIVQIFQVGKSSGVPFLVMEYVDGGSLAEKLRSGPLSVESAVSLVSEIGQALVHAHSKDVIHRDVKPGNILLSKTGKAQICDFGLARKLDAEQSLHETGDIVGTPAYMSPEQARGDRADARSDVYSLGAVLYETLSGRSPFQAANPWEILYLVNSTDPVPLRQLNPALPADLETISQKCLEKNPDRRYQSAEELVDDLKRFSENKPILARPVGTLQKFFKWCRRNRLVAGLGAATFLLLTALAIGSTIAAYKLSASNRQVRAEQQIASEATQQAVADRSLAVGSLNELVDTIENDLKNSSIPLRVKERLAQKAIIGLRQISQIEGDAEAMHASIVAKMQIADLQSQRGKNKEALTDAKEAIKDARLYVKLHPEADDQPILAKALHTLATICSQNMLLDELKIANNEARELLTGFLEEDPDNISLLRRQLHSINLNIDVAWPQMPGTEVAILAKKDAKTATRLYELGKDDPNALATVSAFFGRLGRSCLESNDLDGAEKYLSKSLDAINDALKIDPDGNEYQSSAGVAERMMGSLEYSRINFSKSQRHFENARQKFETLLAQDPANTRYSQNLANIAAMSIEPSSAMGNTDRSTMLLDKCIEINQQLLALSPGSVSSRGQIANALGLKMDIHLRTANWSQAVKDAQTMVNLLDGNEGEAPLTGAFVPFFRTAARISSDSAKIQLGQPIAADDATSRVGAILIAARQFALRNSNDELDADALAQIKLIDEKLDLATIPELLKYQSELPDVHAMLKQPDLLNQARIYSLQARILDQKPGKSEADVQQLNRLTSRAIDHLKQFSKLTPVALNMIYVEPDLKWLRKQAAFADAGLVMEGVDDEGTAIDDSQLP